MFSATEKDKTIKEVAKAYRVVNRSRSTPCIQETMSLHNTTVVELYVEAGQQSESTGYSGGSIKDTEKAPQKGVGWILGTRGTYLLAYHEAGFLCPQAGSFLIVIWIPRDCSKTT